jgi:hypothetical protein
MAKKVVASLRSGKGKNFVKCIKMVHTEKSEAYSFNEEIIHIDHVNDFFNK